MKWRSMWCFSLAAASRLITFQRRYHITHMRFCLSSRKRNSGTPVLSHIKRKRWQDIYQHHPTTAPSRVFRPEYDMPYAPVDQNGTQLYYEDTGVPAGQNVYTTLVLIHGAYYNSGMSNIVVTSPWSPPGVTDMMRAM